MNDLHEFIRLSVINQFTQEGIAERVRCINCDRLADAITKASADSYPNHYDCYCGKCGHRWLANDRLFSPR